MKDSSHFSSWHIYQQDFVVCLFWYKTVAQNYHGNQLLLNSILVKQLKPTRQINVLLLYTGMHSSALKGNTELLTLEDVMSGSTRINHLDTCQTRVQYGRRGRLGKHSLYCQQEQKRSPYFSIQAKTFYLCRACLTACSKIVSISPRVLQLWLIEWLCCWLQLWKRKGVVNTVQGAQLFALCCQQADKSIRAVFLSNSSIAAISKSLQKLRRWGWIRVYSNGILGWRG